MEQKLTQAFDALHMDAKCTTRIEASMSEHRPTPARPIMRSAVAACLVLVLMLIALNPTTVRAMEEYTARLRNYIRRIPGTVVIEEDYVYYNDGHMEIDNRLGQTTGVMLTSSIPSWLRIMDGRVYFTGTAESSSIKYFLEHKEILDITGLFSSEEPFTAIFEKDGITHYVAVGGDFNPEAPSETLEYLEGLRRTDKICEGTYAGWIGGTGKMSYRDAETSLFAIWYAKAVVELELPWNYEEAKAQLDALDVTE